MFQQPPAREPVFNMPPATLLLVLACLGVQIAREFVAPATDLRWVLDFGFIPVRFWSAFEADWAQTTLTRLGAAAFGRPTTEDAFSAVIARHLLADASPRLWTILTYAFLHGDWTHVTVNTIWLAAFGSAVERRVGALRALALFCVGVVAGALLHALGDTGSVGPLIGASAGVSATFGAAARFVFLAGGPIGVIGLRDERAFRLPAPPLAVVLRDRRSLNFILLWAVLNILVGWLAQPLGISASPVAWVAHFGGFLVGLLGFRLFDRPRT